MNSQLETQMNAVHGFSVWLTSAMPSLVESEYDAEFRDHVLHVLDVFERELRRQIDGDPATQDFFALIANTQILARMLLDEILEVHPAILANQPSDETPTVAEMTAKQLGDAVTLFDASMAEMAKYLQTPALPTAITEFVESVQERLEEEW